MGESGWSGTARPSGARRAGTRRPPTCRCCRRARRWRARCAPRLAGARLRAVLTSPRERARRTAELAGLPRRRGRRGPGRVGLRRLRGHHHRRDPRDGARLDGLDPPVPGRRDGRPGAGAARPGGRPVRARRRATPGLRSRPRACARSPRAGWACRSRDGRLLRLDTATSRCSATSASRPSCCAGTLDRPGPRSRTVGAHVADAAAAPAARRPVAQAGDRLVVPRPRADRAAVAAGRRRRTTASPSTWRPPAGFPTYLPWPMSPGWTVTDFAAVGDARPARRATMTCMLRHQRARRAGRRPGGRRGGRHRAGRAVRGHRARRPRRRDRRRAADGAGADRQPGGQACGRSRRARRPASSTARCSPARPPAAGCGSCCGPRRRCCCCATTGSCATSPGLGPQLVELPFGGTGPAW